MRVNNECLLRTDNLTKWFPIRGGFFGRTSGNVKAVNGVSIQVKKGETLGIVGESGCGKTTLARTIMHLTPPTTGHVYFDNSETSKLRGRTLKQFRKRIQMVVQDPYASLDPRQSIESALLEPLKIHHIVNSKTEATKVAEQLIQMVGLSPNHLARYPHEFSGGQRQRVAIARVLAVRPEFVILDEPTSSLDVSVQSQILSLLKKLQTELGLTYMLISHNLAVVRQMCHRTAVMYLGRVVEVAATERLFENPKHPYTKALLASVPIPDPSKRKELQILEGDVPSPTSIEGGCRFRERCPFHTERCTKLNPQLVEIEGNHWVECHYDVDFTTRIAKELGHGGDEYIT